MSVFLFSFSSEGINRSVKSSLKDPSKRSHELSVLNFSMLIHANTVNKERESSLEKTSHRK